MKPSSIEESRVNLGADISKVYYHDNSYAWSMGSQSYIKEAIRNIKKQLSQDNPKFDRKLSDPNYSPKVPFPSIDFKSKLDVSLECS